MRAVVAYALASAKSIHGFGAFRKLRHLRMRIRLSGRLPGALHQGPLLSEACTSFEGLHSFFSEDHDNKAKPKC